MSRNPRLQTALQLLTFALGALALASRAVAIETREIPSSLVPPAASIKRPIPICSQCKVRTETLTSADGSATTGAIAFITHDGGDAFMGEATIVARRLDGSDVQVYHTATLTLANPQPVPLVLSNDEGRLSWDEVAAISVVLATYQ